MKKLLLTLLLAFAFQFLYAQTAVYFCPNTGAVGYYIDNIYAKTYAYNACVNYGGTHPLQVVYGATGGYGAIAIGYDVFGNRVVGATVGYSTRISAEAAARTSCYQSGGQSVYILDSWYDDYEH